METAVARNERLLLRIIVLLRVVLLLQVGAALGLLWDKLAEPVVGALVVGALVAESAAVMAFHQRRGAVSSRVVTVLDVSLGMAALVCVVALLAHSANPDTDDMLYPYSVTLMSSVAVAFRRLAPVLCVATAAAAVYVSATLVAFGEAAGAGVVYNALTYWAWAVMCWAIATRFRTLSGELDAAREDAVAQGAALARERERAGMSRTLHDRVLQTLEFVSREDWITDPRMRDHVAADATWLRELVQGELDGRPTHFVTALHDVVARQTRAGLRVEMNLASLGAVALPDPVADALIGAVTELLTNVRKHAGTGHAVLRATSSETSVTVTVMDTGRGFDPPRPTGGMGLRESVVERLRQVGGEAVITSEPSAGTHVALTVPCTGNT